MAEKVLANRPILGVGASLLVLPCRLAEEICTSAPKDML